MTSLHLGRDSDAPRLIPLVRAFHAEMQIDMPQEDIEAATLPLLEGSPHGAIWLIGPVRAPLGYVMVSFVWSGRRGGLTARVDELFVRPAIRRRGIATDALMAVAKGLSSVGVRELCVSLPPSQDLASKLFARLGYAQGENYIYMRKPMT